MNDQIIEQEIQAKGLTAPRVTPADIEANIKSECYFTAADAFRFGYLTSDPDDSEARRQKNSICDSLAMRSYSGACIDIDANTEIPQPTKLLTFCVLVLRNGFTVVGKSACASPENFDAELGRKIARQDAVSQMWPLMGYEPAQPDCCRVTECDCCERARKNGGDSGWFQVDCLECRVRWLSMQPKHVRVQQYAMLSTADAERLRERVSALWRERSSRSTPEQM